MIKIATLIFLNFSLIAHAGEGRDGSVGNGGNVLICGDVQNLRYNNRTLLLDFAELELSGRGAIFESGDPVELQIDRALLRIKQHSPEIYRELSTEIYRLRLELTLTAGVWHWSSTRDVGAIEVPHHYCTLVAAYIRYENIAEFNQSLYYQMSRTHQAGLWVHEGIYSLARKHARIKTSEPVRLLTAYLFTMIEYPEAIRALTFKYLDQ